MNYIKFNVDTWQRKEHFHVYDQLINCGFSLTTKINITNLKNQIDSTNYSFYPVIIYLLSQVANTYDEFKLAKKMVSLFYGIKLTQALQFSTKKLKHFLLYGASILMIFANLWRIIINS